jgi:hypothetical protein
MNTASTSTTAQLRVLAAHGLRLGRQGRAWLRLDSDDAPLMTGDHRCCVPAWRAAITEDLTRISRGAYTPRPTGP